MSKKQPDPTPPRKSPIAPTQDCAEPRTASREKLRSMLDRFGQYIAPETGYQMTLKLDEFIDKYTRPGENKTR